jgi:LAO/AO transport system kinase
MADVSIVTLVPGAGDEVQALKAGIMEIADIFVLNKADREGADRLASAIETNLSLRTYREDEWRPPIVETVATSGQGVPQLVEAISAFRAHAGRDGGAGRALRRRGRADQRLRELVSQRFVDRLEREVLAPGEWANIVGRVAAREIDPYAAADELLKRAGLKTGPCKDV